MLNSCCTHTYTKISFSCYMLHNTLRKLSDNCGIYNKKKKLLQLTKCHDTERNRRFQQVVVAPWLKQVDRNWSGYRTTHGSCFLFENLFHHIASHDAVSLSLRRRCPGSVADTFQVWCANGFRFTSHLGDLHLHSSDWLQVSIHFIWPVFLYFFKTSQIFI